MYIITGESSGGSWIFGYANDLEEAMAFLDRTGFHLIDSRPLKYRSDIHVPPDGDYPGEVQTIFATVEKLHHVNEGKWFYNG